MKFDPTSRLTENQTVTGNIFKLKTDSIANCSERLNFRKEVRPVITQQKKHNTHFPAYHLRKQNVIGTIYARLLCAL